MDQQPNRATRVPCARLVVLLFALSVALLAACGDEVAPPAGGGPSSDDGRPDITGTVRDLRLIRSGDGGPVATMLVVADGVSGASAYDKAYVTVTPQTTVWRPEGEGRRELDAGALRDGVTIAVWFTGPVAESYPVQATAGDIEVLGGGLPD